MAMRNAFVLKHKVVHFGKDFFGKDAVVKVSPRYRKDPGEWVWRSYKDWGKVDDIDPTIVETGKRRIELRRKGESLSVWEHAGVLRFFNLLGGLEFESSGWLPYDGCAHTLWSAIKPVCTTKTIDLPVYSTNGIVRYEYPDHRGGRIAFTEIRPSSDGNLYLDITRSFKGLGTLRKKYVFPDNELLERICKVRALGWPPVLYTVSKVLSKVTLWPHHNSVLWPQDHSPEVLIEAVVDHAALDTLGALSLLCRDGTFAGDVVSVCSGHEADVGAVKQAWSCLARIG